MVAKHTRNVLAHALLSFVLVFASLLIPAVAYADQYSPSSLSTGSSINNTGTYSASIIDRSLMNSSTQNYSTDVAIGNAIFGIAPADSTDILLSVFNNNAIPVKSTNITIVVNLPKTPVSGDRAGYIATFTANINSKINSDFLPNPALNSTSLLHNGIQKLNNNLEENNQVIVSINNNIARASVDALTLQRRQNIYFLPILTVILLFSVIFIEQIAFRTPN